jgi:hypothetical protein
MTKGSGNEINTTRKIMSFVPVVFCFNIKVCKSFSWLSAKFQKRILSSFCNSNSKP